VADDLKYHIDHHARLIPPAELTAVHEAVARGQAGEEELRAAEDAAITAAVKLQRRIGLSALSDGEFRRPHRLSVVYDGVDGFGPPVPGGVLTELLGPSLAPERRVLLDQPIARGRLTSWPGCNARPC